ncbi:kinase-like protein [Thelephora terrestris]|uniref:non-specific serine/threonine protein kinase n=1 Tax=Thelephora terrestris TaxID=56493 RepID=A0A9P6HG91_9AGAM|nr:kinase-like protein [Thelephora terrestris]
MSTLLNLYEPLDVIGNGSFGIIRKVKRKSDGLIFARKELYFERMSDRDKKQIVAEVNILKDLQHEHIVRYHDRYVDRDAGVLYILMEYCGGGDLSSVIKQSQRQNKTIPEELIWNYFMQILLALSYCHHPNGHSRSGSSSTGTDSECGKDKRPQILHRDLKPDNVFLDENNRVKLGDFGLSKALAQASFAQTYVGTPYYMSPELMQEKAYDSKSDIWSLGCLIYELCALKPPFHEAKTHSELSILVRNGRIPPLPRGYSQALSNTIKAMLSQNPAMRPSAAQLLQHERIDLAYKVTEAEKMIARIKTHRAAVTAREEAVQSRETALTEKETQLASLLQLKDAEISALQQLISTADERHRHVVEARIRDAVSQREEELRALVVRHQQEVSAAMAKREEELMEAVKRREEELRVAWIQREQEIRDEMSTAVEERMEWVRKQMEEVEEERRRLDATRTEVENKVKVISDGAAVEKPGGRKEKTYLEEVKNVLAPLSRLAALSPEDPPPKPPVSMLTRPMADFKTPLTRKVGKTPFDSGLPLGSAMKGVVLTSTGETLTTPAPAQFTNLFVATPKVGLHFEKIFDESYEEEDTQKPEEPTQDEEISEAPSDTQNAPPTPSKPERKTSSSSAKKLTRTTSVTALKSTSSSSSSSKTTTTRASSTRTRRTSLIPTPPTKTGLTRTTSASGIAHQRSSSEQPTASSSRISVSAMGTLTRTKSSQVAVLQSSPIQWDLQDEENLPSPFLKKAEKERQRAATFSHLREQPQRKAKTTTVTGPVPKRRPSEQNILRAYAAANAMTKGGS